MKLHWLLVLLIVLVSAPSLAQEPDETPEAKSERYKAEGDALMDQRDYAAALEAYDKAYEALPSPRLLYNRGKAHQRLANYPKALELIEAFEREAPADLKDQVPTLADLLTKLRSQVSTLVITCNQRGARVLVRDKLVGETPIGELKLNAGVAVVEVSLAGYRTEKLNVKLPGNTTVPLNVVLREAKPSGRLIVTSDTPGAVVEIDGEYMGPVPVNRRISAGEHNVVVSASGYDSIDTQVVVPPRKKRTVKLDLEPTSLVEAWWLWTAVGVVVAGGVAAVCAAVLIERPADEGDIEPRQISAPLQPAPTIMVAMPLLHF